MDTYQGSIFDPTSLHKYLYANANPVMNSDPSGYFTLGDVNVSQAISNILDKAESLNYIKIYQHLKGKLNAINNALTIYDTCRQIAMIINDPNLSSWQMIEGIACGVITSLFINHMCQMKAIGPIISKVMTGYGLFSQWESIMEAANNKDWDLVGTRSIQLIISLMSLHQTCFTGETLVAAENGQKRIDEIEVGDKVWAYDIYTGETELKEVLTVFIHDQTEILHLQTTAGDIDTTTNHPFYVIDKGWVAAGDLIIGDEVYLIDGSTAVVTGLELERLAEPIKVYNLEVEDYHTYFVGDVPVLVHNYGVDNGNSPNLPTDGTPVKVNRQAVINSASAPKKGGETILGHALQKHGGRHPEIWGKVKGNSNEINQTALQHLIDILDAPGDFLTNTNARGVTFLEKWHPDGRGVRLNMDQTFKCFIDQK